MSKTNECLGRHHLYKLGLTKGKIDYLHSKFPTRFGFHIHPGSSKTYTFEDAIEMGRECKVEIRIDEIARVLGGSNHV